MHPAILLRNPRRRARLAVALTTGSVCVAAAMGASIYPQYRIRLKQHIFIEQSWLGWVFERKEHLGVGVVAFALTGCIAHLAAPRFADEAQQTTMSRLAHRAFVVSFVLAVFVASFGVAVASYKSF
jgi:hypothetical protein